MRVHVFMMRLRVCVGVCMMRLRVCVSVCMGVYDASTSVYDVCTSACV